MTQAYNLSQFANNLNSSGKTANSGLQNPSVTVTAGTGMSGGGSVALGASVTLTNAGVTSLTAGTGISLSASTGGVTITNSAPGGVTSLNGQTGAITNTTFGAIGGYILGRPANASAYATGDTVSGSALYAMGSLTYYDNGSSSFLPIRGVATTTLVGSGTYRCVSPASGNGDAGTAGLWVRVS
jgi:hypothetical protein